MAWKINYLKSVQKEIKKITKKDQNKIREYLEGNITELDAPRSLGKAIKGALSEFWRDRGRLIESSVKSTIKRLQCLLFVLDIEKRCTGTRFNY